MAVVEATVARVEWEEGDVGVDTAGLRCRVVPIAVEAPAAEARAGTCRDPATAQVVWLQIGTSPAETSTDPKPPPKFNPVRKALGPVFLRLLKETGRGPARAATKGSPMSRTKLAAANSLGEVKELEPANSLGEVKVLGAASLQAKSKAVRVAGCRAVNWARWRAARWRGARSAPVSLISAEAIWAAEAVWAVQAVRAA